MADFVHNDFSTCAVAVGTTSNRVSSTKTSKTSGLSSTPASSVSLASSRLTSSGVRVDIPAAALEVTVVRFSDFKRETKKKEPERADELTSHSLPQAPGERRRCFSHPASTTLRARRKYPQQTQKSKWLSPPRCVDLP